MFKRLGGVLLYALLCLPLTAAPAFATQAGGQEGSGEGAEPAEGVAPEGEELEAPPERDDVCSRNEVVAEYCPDPYEAPTVFAGILYPLLGIGALVSIALFLLYIRWLPNFAQERRSTRARGRR